MPAYAFLRERSLVIRVVLALAVTAYTIAAAIIDFTRAMPLIIMEVVIVSCLLLGQLQLQRLWKPNSTPVASRRPRTRWRSRIAALLLVALHLLVAVLLGAVTIQRWVPIAGLASITICCYWGSNNRLSVRWRPVLAGFALQFWLCVLLLRTTIGMAVVEWAAAQVGALLGYTNSGACFVFGPVASQTVWAFKVLSVTIFFSSLCSILLHLGWLQTLFGRLGGALALLLGVSRAEAICAVANSFLGQTEAPLLIKPIVGLLNASQLHAVMAGGFASVSGSTLGAYILMGAPAAHLLAASVMSAPASIAIAKLLHPDDQRSPRKLQNHAPRGKQQHRRLMGAPIIGVSAAPQQDSSGDRSLADGEAVSCSVDVELQCTPGHREPTSSHCGERPDSNVGGGSIGDGQRESTWAPAGQPEAVSADADDSMELELPPSETENIVQAAAEGAINAVPLVACIAATLISFLALVTPLHATSSPTESTAYQTALLTTNANRPACLHSLRTPRAGGDGRCDRSVVGIADRY